MVVKATVPLSDSPAPTHSMWVTKTLRLNPNLSIHASQADDWAKGLARAKKFLGMKAIRDWHVDREGPKEDGMSWEFHTRTCI